MADEYSFPKVLLMGLKQSGKSSIQKVVFGGMQPHESINLPTTVQPERSTVASNEFVKFDVWDFPGQNDPFDTSGSSRYKAHEILDNCGVIVFVMDCKTDKAVKDESIRRLMDTITVAFQTNPDVCIEVFMHKVDALSEEHQNELLATTKRYVEEAAKSRLEPKKPLKLNFNLTSIYDHSVFEAFSNVVQRLISAQSPYIVELLSMLNNNCNINTSFLFLSKSKIFLASDERNREYTKPYVLCSDAIHMLLKINDVYSPIAGDGLADPNGGATAVIRLQDECVLYVRELPSALTLVMLLREEHFQNKAVIDYNVSVFSNAANDIFFAGKK